MSDRALNIWGAVGSGFGAVTAIPALFSSFRSVLPRSKLAVLRHVLLETEAQFRAVVEAGLIKHHAELHSSMAWFWSLQFRADDIQADGFLIETTWQDIKAWWNGKSTHVTRLVRELNTFRSKLARSSSRARRDLAATGHAAHLASVLVPREPSLRGWRATSPSQYHDPPTPAVFPTPGITPVPTVTEAEDVSVQSADTLAPPLTQASVTLAPEAALVSDAPPRYTSGSPDVAQEQAPEHRFSPDDELRRLMSLALKRRSRNREERQRQGAARRELLQWFGTDLFGPGAGMPSYAATSQDQAASHTPSASGSVGAGKQCASGTAFPLPAAV